MTTHAEGRRPSSETLTLAPACAESSHASLLNTPAAIENALAVANGAYHGLQAPQAISEPAYGRPMQPPLDEGKIGQQRPILVGRQLWAAGTSWPGLDGEW